MNREIKLNERVSKELLTEVFVKGMTITTRKMTFSGDIMSPLKIEKQQRHIQVATEFQERNRLPQFSYDGGISGYNNSSKCHR